MLNKRATYGDDWGVPSAEHPAGECLNRSAPGVEDGSYFEKAWVNDLMALPGALMNSAGYTPNGTEDTATASQVFDALINGRWSAIGNYSPGTIVTASDGKQYYCKKQNGRDTSILDPATKTNRDVWVGFPYEDGSGQSGDYRIHYDGTIEQWLTSGNSDSEGFATVTLATKMTSSSYRALATEVTAQASPTTAIAIVGIIVDSRTTSSFKIRMVNSDSTPTQGDSSFVYVKGK